jgi:outer membrane protein TolC
MMFKIQYIKRVSTATQSLAFGVLLCFSTYLKAQTLDELKTLSAENNLELKAQYKRFEAQLENVTQAKAWQDPNLSFGYFISPIETRVGPQIARFSLTQMLPWFGTYKAKGNIAGFRAEAEFEKFQDQKLKLYLDVAETYYDLSALRHIVQLEAKQLQILEEVKSIVKSNYENNQTRLIDVLRVELQIDEQTNALQVLSDQDAAMLTQLNQLLNRPLSTPVLIPNPKQILEQQNLIAINSISDDHPRLEAIRKLQASNKAERVLAQKQALPQFGVGLDYAIIQDRNVMNADAGKDAIMPMLSVSLPIFAKKNKSRIQQASLQGESLQLQLEDEASQLKAKIQVATYKLDELIKSVALHDQQMKTLDDILELSTTALANAEMQVEEVLRLYEEHVLHHKMKIRTLADLQKINETLSYLTSNSEL